MAKQKISEAERLQKKREYEKKRRLAVNSDPEAKKKLQEKERLKYLAKKEKGIVKPVAILSARDKRLKRKQWRVNSRQYREKKKNNIELPADLISRPMSGVPCSVQQKTGRKKVRRDRTKLYRSNLDLKRKLADAKRVVEKLRKREWRWKKGCATRSGGNVQSTPRSKVRTFLQGENVSKKVRRKLVFGEALSAELENSFSRQKSAKHKQIFVKVISGKVLKKYRLLHACKTFLKYRMFKANEGRRLLSVYERKKRSGHVTEQMRHAVVEFLEKDENSRMCPGKKDCITKRGVKMQKRLLNDTLIRLHQNFLTERRLNQQYKISYSTFCLLKPFYIVQPRIQDRETCKCSKHANMELLIASLHNTKVIDHRDLSATLEEVCCKPNNVACLLRQCKHCKDLLTTFNIFDKDEKATYIKWVSSKFSYIDKGVEKVSQRPCKQVVESDLGNMVDTFLSELPLFMKHEASNFHHHKSICNLKEILGVNEIIVHMDFSENYACKHSEEIQAVHFGGARQQISIHTVVVYCKEENETKAHSLASLSSNLRHDPAAIWAHLIPVFEWVKTKMGGDGIHTVHFVSDSPATQYRNKKMFYLISHYLRSLTSATSCTWNYSESGHGKGAPDGVGGVLKRTADSIVAHGTDLPDFDSLISALEKRVKGVKLFTVLSENIDKMDHLFDGKKIETFVGTMKVHQVAFSAEKKCSSFRSLSCFDCMPGDKCVHYNLGLVQYLDLQTTPDSDDTGILLEAPMECSDGEIDVHLREGDWVAVLNDGISYPGEVRRCSNDSITVSTMEESGVGRGTYCWPRPLNVKNFSIRDVQQNISAPKPYGNRANQFHFNNYP